LRVSITLVISKWEENCFTKNPWETTMWAMFFDSDRCLYKILYIVEFTRRFPSL
jgi:hypothetical protein